MPNGRRMPMLPGQQNPQDIADRFLQAYLAKKDLEMKKKQMALTEGQVKKQDLIQRWEMTRGNMSDEAKAEWLKVFGSAMPEYPVEKEKKKYKYLSPTQRKIAEEIDAGVRLSAKDALKLTTNKKMMDLKRAHDALKGRDDLKAKTMRDAIEEEMRNELGIILPNAQESLWTETWNTLIDTPARNLLRGIRGLYEGKSKLKLQKPTVTPEAPGPIQRRLRPKGQLPSAAPITTPTQGQPLNIPPVTPSPIIPKPIPPAEEATDEDYIKMLMENKIE